MSPRSVFVAGAHTEIGKTHVACALIGAARAAGLTVEALKPVVSGFDEADWVGSDPGRVLAALGRPLTPQALDRLSPWRFAAPLAPPLAAELEGRSLPFEPVVQFCRDRRAEAGADLLVIEGVGGVMSPITHGATCLDLIQAIEPSSIVLVGGSYLGAISHTLTAREVLCGRGLPLAALVLSQAGEPDAPDFSGAVGLTRLHAPSPPVIAASRDGSGSWAKGLLELVS
jgi:dethiobiotin synthetase